MDEPTARTIQTIAVVLGVLVSLGIGAVAIIVASRAADVAESANEISQRALEISSDARDAEAAQAGIAVDALATAQRQIEVAHAAEIARQREVHILDVRPLLVSVPITAVHATTQEPTAIFEIRVDGAHPILDAMVTIRGTGEGGKAASASRGTGSIAPGQGPYHVPIEYYWLYSKDQPRRPYNALAWVDITYRGILGQRVVETYEWHLDRQMNSAAESWWHLGRLQIEPNVEGADAVDLTFGEP